MHFLCIFVVLKFYSPVNPMGSCRVLSVIFKKQEAHGPWFAHRSDIATADMQMFLIQEAHGPRFAHLSDIATADMQMLCNIFPILSSQLMKISSFEQFLVLKKNIWA